MISSSNENSSSTYEPTVYTLLLTGMCLLLALFLLTRLLVALRNKNKLLAWSTGFYVLCLLWTGVRAAYWIIMSTQSSMRYLTLYLLYWSPTPIQFANFSLLILFYIQVLTGPDWRSKWRNVCLPLYLLLTMTMATFTVVWAFNSSNDISKAARRGDEYDQEFSRVSDVSVQLKYSAFSFFLLSVLFGFFGWKMANVESWKRRRLLISRPRSLAVINSLLCFIFFTRGIRDLVTSQSWFLSIWNNLDMNGRVTTAGGVGAPKHGPASQKLPDYGIFHIINTEGSVGFEQEPERERPRWTHGGDLFQDPLRYDSDDGPVPSPRHFSDSYNSDASNSNYYYERVPGHSMRT
ncbi:hypothetical protein PC129_g3784 [Phytophthora cactorum]|uniref:Uncharacterized protein n=1 Tax=Phytophthora cactorum TaxID=29920 RepID=A0A8T1FVF1_9STRA|nr:hypothetical protein PC118_g12500 [Phytophthora cactorum]KAG3010758.1 hypothetical protein PC119_g13419 [Phytophthora cactorum]KAG3107155.1 hypothetical protein PI125_g12997 [Phytophthora idaei]KAG3150113.1 hypothetical protein PI126_g11682 [Phytophthora idaei]KAG3225617.1 hypothetical protein PC129_g3784 [Phytophthora cactorum]